MPRKRTKSQTLSHSTIVTTLHPPITHPTHTEPQTFKFISSGEYSTYLTCPICHSLMIRPMRLHPCGHTFCEKCIEPLEKDVKKKVCPVTVCSRKFQLLQNDRTAESLIDQLKVACSNDGCVWKGEFDKYKKTHKESCLFKNGGLNGWLTQLTEGIVLTQRNSHNHNEGQQPKDNSQQMGEFASKSQTLQPRIDEHQIEESQNLIPYQKQEYHFEQEKKQAQYLSTQDNEEKVQNRGQSNQTIRQQQHEKMKMNSQEVKENQSVNMNQGPLGQKNEEQKQEKSTNQSIGSNLTNPSSGFNIFNIPFGPSLEQQLNSSERRKSNYMKKQLKKLQGFS